MPEETEHTQQAPLQQQRQQKPASPAQQPHQQRQGRTAEAAVESEAEAHTQALIQALRAMLATTVSLDNGGRGQCLFEAVEQATDLPATSARLLAVKQLERDKHAIVEALRHYAQHDPATRRGYRDTALDFAEQLWREQERQRAAGAGDVPRAMAAVSDAELHALVPHFLDLVRTSLSQPQRTDSDSAAPEPRGVWACELEFHAVAHWLSATLGIDAIVCYREPGESEAQAKQRWPARIADEVQRPGGAPHITLFCLDVAAGHYTLLCGASGERVWSKADIRALADHATAAAATPVGAAVSELAAAPQHAQCSERAASASASTAAEFAGSASTPRSAGANSVACLCAAVSPARLHVIAACIHAGTPSESAQLQCADSNHDLDILLSWMHLLLRLRNASTQQLCRTASQILTLLVCNMCTFLCLFGHVALCAAKSMSVYLQGLTTR